MEFRYIGKTGLRVSPICLGTMTFGSQCDKKTAFRIMDLAYENGVNFFDTAETYPVPPTPEMVGISERIVGEWLKTKPRGAILLATKIAGAASGWFVPPVRHGLTAMDAHHIRCGIEGSLKRLGTDYIDLYQMHWPDSVVPREETMKAFHSLVQEGKVRYLGTSNDSAHGTTKSNMIARYENYTRFESIQNHFSLLNRRFLDGLAEMCTEETISLLPYSPMAGGVLSGKYNLQRDCTGRFTSYSLSDNPRIRGMVKRFVNAKTLASTAKYMDLAKKIGLATSTLAVAWSKQHNFVASTIVGANTTDQLKESLLAMDLELDEETLRLCDAIHEEFPYPMG